jgi:hypothetical protein
MPRTTRTADRISSEGLRNDPPVDSLKDRKYLPGSRLLLGIVFYLQDLQLTENIGRKIN